VGVNLAIPGEIFVAVLKEVIPGSAMPIGSCEHCHHQFVIEAADSLQRVCPVCLRPMQMTSLEAIKSDFSTRAAGTRAANSASARTATGFAVAWLGDHPLAVDAMGQRVLKALSQAACTCHEAAEARAAAQATRRQRPRGG
jgi:hypothetical protein